MQQTKAAGIYCRLSYAPDGSLEKVERQEADCRELSARLGWPIYEVYPDNSRSAWQRNRKRPAWDRMLTDIEAGKIDAIVVYHGDRLIRQPWDLEMLLKLADDRSLPLASVSGTRDLNNEDDRFILRIEAAHACRESADKSRRVKRGWKARAENGKSAGGGKRPTGFGVPTGQLSPRTGKPLYDTDQHNPGEAAFLLEAAERLLAGSSAGAVLAWLRSEGHKTSGGKDFTLKALKNNLLAPRIAGLVEHGGVLREAVWEPIISRDMWEDLTALFKASAEKYGYWGRERKYLLSGVAECQHGIKVSTKPTGGRNRPESRVYFPEDRCVGRDVEHLDAYVEGRALRVLQDPGLLREIGDAKRPGIGPEVATLERRRDDARKKLRALADHPDLDPDDLAEAIASYSRKIRQLRESHASSTRQRLLARMAGITREQWDDLPVDVRSDTVAALFRVVVLPTSKRGPGFDTSAVRLERIR